jgi:putative DNA primase/helicase
MSSNMESIGETDAIAAKFEPLRRTADKVAATAKQNNRLLIQIREGDLHVIASEAEQALIAFDAPFYQRGGLGLVRPILDEGMASNGSKTKTARLKVVELDCLIDHLSQAAEWVKWDGRKKGLVPKNPPKDVAKIILAREGYWQFRKITGVVTTPTLRPDGTILAEPGYDARTRLLLLRPPKLPAISERPTRDDALHALRTLGELLEGFPFVDGASKSVAYSALITPVVRGALSVAPMHAVSAPVAGSGKSYIVDLASAISAGDRTPVQSPGGNEQEFEKRLTGAVLAGQAIISIDNVNGELGGDFLCQMIERPLVAVRPLGGSTIVQIESRASSFATGNNIRLVGDMTRRVVLCSLDPDMERPETRTFSSNPFEMVLADRGKYIAAALTIARAYSVAGYPQMLNPLASFEDWSRVVRSALVWLGCSDPCETMTKARADDPVSASLGALLATWHDVMGDDGAAAGTIKEKAIERNPGGHLIHEAFHEAVATFADDKRGGIDTAKLGRECAKYKGRIINGLKLIATYDTHSKKNLWAVVRSGSGCG